MKRVTTDCAECARTSKLVVAKVKRTQGAIQDRVELYYAANPGGAAARRRPRVTKQGGTWVVILGPNVTQGVVGIGNTVEGALRAFDTQYVYHLRPMAA
jgi:hypothetical protein